jgi:hypothetical protein
VRERFYRWLAFKLYPYFMEQRKRDAARLISLVRTYQPREKR